MKIQRNQRSHTIHTYTIKKYMKYEIKKHKERQKSRKT